eukprot:4847789-Amphidinium_carterae.1
MSVQARDMRPHLTVPVWLFRQSSGYTAMFKHLDNINKGSCLFSEALTRLGLKPTHHAERHAEIYAAMQEVAYQELGIKSNTFLIGTRIKEQTMRRMRLKFHRS